jgi:polysaccharide chain length determinant protein (PEP-CTERM system associated)
LAFNLQVHQQMPGFTELAPPADVFAPAGARRNPSAFAPLSVLRTLWKRKILILAIWLFVTVVTMAVAYNLPPLYRSEAVILIESQRIPERFVATTVNVDLQSRLNTIGQTILSFDRLWGIVQKFDLYRKERSKMVQEEIIELMRKDIEIRPVREMTERRPTDGPGAFRISYQGRNAAVVMQVASQLTNLFIEENLRVRETQAMGTSEFLDNQLADAKRRLEQQEALLGKYKQQYNGELPEQQGALTGMLGRLQSQLGRIQDDMNRMEANRLMLTSALETAQASEAALTQIAVQTSAARIERSGRSTGVAPAKTRAELLAEQIEVLRRQYTDEHPDIVRMKQQLAAIEGQESAKPAAAANGGETAPTAAAPRAPEVTESVLRERERVEGLRAQLAAADKQVQGLQAERGAVSKRLEELDKQIQKLPLREQELAALMRDYEISRTNYQSLQDKKLAAEMSAEMEKRQKGERFMPLETARMPEKPIKPDRPLISLAGCAGGLMLGLLAGFARESKVNAILGEWELPRSVPILGRVPQTEVGPRARRQRARRRLNAAIAVALALMTLGVAAAVAAVYVGLIS